MMTAMTYLTIPLVAGAIHSTYEIHSILLAVSNHDIGRAFPDLRLDRHHRW